MYDELSNVDFVPTNLPVHKGRAKLVLLEDNGPVIQICIKGRNPTLRHVPRVHRVNTDACYERIRGDPGIFLRYWPTKYQLADILTKGSFTKLEWDRLVDLLQIRPYKRTQKEKDVQAMISQPERFQIHDGSDEDVASIPTIEPNHKNRKNINNLERKIRNLKTKNHKNRRNHKHLKNKNNNELKNHKNIKKIKPLNNR